LSHVEPHLKIVDADTGEVLPNCPGCLEREAEIRALETEKRGWRVRYQNLARDKELDARRHGLWPAALELFEYWQEKCRHPRSEWDADCFYQALPFLERDGLDACKIAIDGASYDPKTRTRRNGSVERFDSWELIFRNRNKFESFCNRAPRSSLRAFLGVGVPAGERLGGDPIAAELYG